MKEGLVFEVEYPFNLSDTCYTFLHGQSKASPLPQSEKSQKIAHNSAS